MATISKSYSLLPVPDKLDFDKSRHLLQRCVFGPKKSEIDALVGQSISSAISTLMALPTTTTQPVNNDARDLAVGLGQSWVSTSYNSTYNPYRINSLRAWWIGNMVTQPATIFEKMVLFWHNHFVTEISVVNNAHYSYQYIQVLRNYALGNIKKMVYDITINPAVLVYLNGNANVVGAPNENFGRELFELFTIGKGPLIAAGNYTNYTESDIREAAKVLTGWTINATTLTGVYNTSRHDKTTKTFSAAFSNQTIANKEVDEYKLLIDMIFSKKETARYLVRKIYRWLMYYTIDKDVEDQIIEPLATTLFDNNYEIKPVLIQLLGSDHFFSQDFRGAYIKNPLDFSIGIFRKCEIPMSTDLMANYGIWTYIFNSVVNMEMTLGDPPDVAGWPQYYKEPLFNELWVNSSTVPNRTSFSNVMSLGGVTYNGFKYVIDPFLLIPKISNPGDPIALITGLTQILLPVSISSAKQSALKEILIPGLPDTSWTSEWIKYAGNPADATQKNLIRTKLLAVIAAILRMPEFYLS